MKIWHLFSDVDHYENLVPVSEFSAEEIQAFDGRELKSSWKPLPVRRMEPQKKLELSDFPGFTIPVFSEKAVSILDPLIKNSSEKLELVFEKKYYGINVTTVLDVIDYEHSQYLTYKGSNRIMVFEKYAFLNNGLLDGVNIFKIVDEPRRWPFVSDIFKKTVEKNNLTGFKFRLVWDSDEFKEK